MPTTIGLQQQHTIQDATRQQTEHSTGILFWLANAGQIISPWWSKKRDSELRAFWKDSDHFAGATYMIASKLTSVPFSVQPRDATVKSHIKISDDFNMMLDEMPQFGKGWEAFWTRFLIDLWTMDNGGFGEVIGDGDPTGPIVGPPLGLAHLDSFSCYRTSNPEYPVVYLDSSGDGKRYKLHHTRVIYSSQLPSPAAEMLSVGHCWLTRAINIVQNLIDISVYKQEKMGSRPLRSILTGSGIHTDAITGAIAMAEESMDNQGLSRYAKTAVIAQQQPFELSLLDLISLPDGFDERTSVELGMFLIALTGGFPPRWLWPATTTGATRADAMYQHISGTGGGATWHLNMMQRLLGGSPRGARSVIGKFLPPYLRLVFDYQDDEQDRLQSDIRQTRAGTREKNLVTGVTDIRTEREDMLTAGDLTRAQFEALELESGRLPDGSDVITLFSSQDEFIVSLLDLGVAEPLLVTMNDASVMLNVIEMAILEVQETLLQTSTANAQKRTRQAIAALEKLRELYEGAGRQPSNAMPEPVEETDGGELEESDEEPAEEPADKSRSSHRADFAFNIRASIRGLWTGQFERFDFIDSMIIGMERGLRFAWLEGAAECDIAEDELSPAEISAMRTLTNSQFPHLIGFAEDIEAGSKANGGKLGPLLARGRMWSSQYDTARNQAMAMACGDKKLEWRLGKAEHCDSCIKLAGKVKRASWWAENGIFPRVPGAEYLICKGFNCACSLVPVTFHLSPGPMPKLP